MVEAARKTMVENVRREIVSLRALLDDVAEADVVPRTQGLGPDVGPAERRAVREAFRRLNQSLSGHDTPDEVLTELFPDPAVTESTSLRQAGERFIKEVEGRDPGPDELEIWE